MDVDGAHDESDGARYQRVGHEQHLHTNTDRIKLTSYMLFSKIKIYRLAMEGFFIPMRDLNDVLLHLGPFFGILAHWRNLFILQLTCAGVVGEMKNK